jgi:sialic acid synthase SpsE
MFRCVVGLSDHTLGVGAAVASIALGARVIEKHFVLDRSAGGVDAVFSLEPEEMKTLVEESQRAFEAIGTIKYGPTSAEKDSMRFRRSLYFVKDMQAGATITEDCLRAIRPGYGLQVKYYDLLIGKKVNRPISKGTPASFDLWD